MKFLSSFTPRAIAVSALLLFAVFTFAAPAWAQDAAKVQPPPAPKVSDGESKLADKINKAPDAAAKLAAAEEFVKKYPTSPLRGQLADHLTGQVLGVKDDAQKIAAAEKFLTIFSGAGEDVHVAPFLVESYIAAQRFDDAFRTGGAWLAKSPEDVSVLAPLAFHAIDQARRNNPKFTAQGQQYLVKAVELFEAGKKPAGMEDAQFADFKTAWLPQLYQVQALLALNSGNAAEAAARAQKAAAINTTDPINYYLVGSARNEEYQKMAQQYQTMPAGTQKTEMMNQINAKLDEVIDLYARTVALAAGIEQHKGLHDQTLQDMTSYYKFRHNGSTDGMQALIDKYKKPATP